VIGYVADGGVGLVGLWNMSISIWEYFLMIRRSRKLIWLLDSSVGVSCRLLCVELAYCTMASGLVREAS